MTDIIIINPSHFFEKRLELDKETSIYKKYDDLFKKYQCFSNTQINLFVPPKNDYSFKGNNRYNNKKNHFNDERPTYADRKPKDLNKIILGILNVLNNDNYHKMFTKIRLMKNEHNISKIILEILDKCSIQVFYLNIYMRLIEDIVNICSDIESKIAIEAINKFVNYYIDNSEWMNEYIAIDKDDEYNSFCNSQKLKSLLIAKNMMINRLMTIFNLEKSVEEYGYIIITDLKKTLELKNENVCILLIQMLIYMLKTVKPLVKKIFDIDHKYIYSRVVGSKTKFVIDEFLAILKS
jgi:hypothetical protein